MGLLNDAGGWLAGMLETGAGVSVDYVRVADPGTTLPLTPWVGRSAFLLEADFTKRTQWGERDYILSATSLVDASGAVVQPQVGDRLTETINDVSHVFEICKDSAATAWRWVDQGRTMLRLHVRRMS